MIAGFFYLVVAVLMGWAALRDPTLDWKLSTLFVAGFASNLGAAVASIARWVL